MIVRPPEYLDDVRLRELEMQAAEARLVAARLRALPALRLRGRGRLPALPELHAQAQGALPLVRQAARPDVAALPVLRGRDRGRHARPASRAAAGAAPRRPRTAVAEASPRLLALTTRPIGDLPMDRTLSWSSRTRSRAA